MDVLALDFEAYFDDQYTLKKLSSEAYIRDSRFQPHILGIYRPGQEDNIRGAIGREAIQRLVDGIDWPNTLAIAHHAQFDGLILWHHFGAAPARWACTLSMARTQSRARVGERLSLEALAAKIGASPKTVDYDAFKGKRTEALGEERLNNLLRQCYDDCRITYDVFDYLMRDCRFPVEELEVIDLTIRMFSEPCLRGNDGVFRGIAESEMARKADLLNKLGIDRGQLASANRFKQLLEERGILVHQKPGKKGLIPALAKTDAFVDELRNHEDSVVRDLIDARLAIKSTLSETRAARLACISERGPLPVYLRYCSAHTTRWGGGDDTNFQNFPREGDLRSGIEAPEGHVLIIKDYEQIEARTLLTCAGQWDQVERYENGEDLYVLLASIVYNVPVEAVTAAQRGFGKLLILSCGFGAGDLSIQRTAKRGTYGAPLEITLQEAARAKWQYRNDNPRVPWLWDQCSSILAGMISGRTEPYTIEGLPVTIAGRSIVLPNGLNLDYSSLHFDNYELQPGQTITELTRELPDLLVRHQREFSKIYGGKLTENIIQALARVILSQALCRIMADPVIKAYKVRCVLTAHDELVFVCVTEHVEEVSKLIDQYMVARPAWLSRVPLAVKTTIAPSYRKG